MTFSTYSLAPSKLGYTLVYSILFPFFFGAFQSSCQVHSVDEDRAPILDDSQSFIKVKDRILLNLDYANGVYAIAGNPVGSSCVNLGDKLCQAVEGKSAKPYQNLVQLGVKDQTPVVILDSILNELRSVGLGVVFQNDEKSRLQAIIFLPQIPKTLLSSYTTESSYFPSPHSLKQCIKSGTTESHLGQAVSPRSGPPGLPPPPPKPSAVYDSIKFLLDFEGSAAYMNTPAVIISKRDSEILLNHKPYDFSEAATKFKALLAKGPKHIMVVMQAQQTKLDYVKLCDFVGRFKNDETPNAGGRMHRSVVTHLTLTDQAINNANR